MTDLALRTIQIILIIIVMQAVLSWLIAAGVRNDVVIRFYQTINGALDPLFRPLRRVIPPFGMFDLTPIVAIVILIVLAELIARLG